MKKRILSIILIVLLGIMPISACSEGGVASTELLKDKYQDYFSIGAALGYENMTVYEGGEYDLVSHFNSMTAENEMKWANLQGSDGNFNFKLADEQIAFAQRNDMAVRGHALLWYQSAPSYIFQGADGGEATKEEVLSKIRTHVDTVTKHFADQVYVWDVVNEVISDSGDDIFRTSVTAPFYETTGIDFIVEAFNQARTSLDEVGATDVKLFYNDYSMTDPAKRAKTIEMIKQLQALDVPIDGIGMQSHYNIWSFDVDQFELAIKEFSELGLEVQITELDLDIYASQTDTALSVFPDALATLQATVYDQIFTVCREYKDVITNVTFWSIADDYSWLNKLTNSSVERQNYPMLFDIFHEAKPAFYAVMDF